jgi:hypothetical protein
MNDPLRQFLTEFIESPDAVEARRAKFAGGVHRFDAGLRSSSIPIASSKSCPPPRAQLGPTGDASLAW